MKSIEWGLGKISYQIWSHLDIMGKMVEVVGKGDSSEKKGLNNEG